jgi:tRNA (guanine37-N1)-methyltransferase
MIVDVITLFPEMFGGVVGSSILKIAREKGLVEIGLVNLRDFSTDKHRKVDAPPYGGGPGMVIQVEPTVRAVEHLRGRPGRGRSRLILLTPAGKKFDQATAWELSKEEGMILLCGHYEGFDERVRTLLRPDAISIGDFVLTGGEIPAMAVLDAVARLVPGVLGSPDSLREESFTSGGLEYPHYTRPAEFRGARVPEVLASGDHAKVAAWRREQALARTRERRPDLEAGPKNEEEMLP